jgi:TolB-like protein
MRFVRPILLAVAVGFAAPSVALAQGNAAGIAKLEKKRAERPKDAAVARSLGIAYYKADKFAEARTHLDAATRLNPRDGSATLYLGLTAERLNDIPAAKAAYQSYVRYGRTSKVRKQLEARLAALVRQELTVAAKAAVAQEQQLSTQAGNAKTVAVMPLRFQGSDTTLAPLERGLAELLTIDLARSHELTVVERSRIQALLDEIKLQQSGATDATTNVRTGKIIQAGRIVSGGIIQDANRLRVDAAIVNTQTSGLAGGATNENTLEQLFAIEKAIVKQLFDSLGVTLTEQEKKDLELVPTRNFQAFLAYSRGLMLEDQGRFDDASRSFGEAMRIDPAFFQAQQKTTQNQAAAVGVTLTAITIEQNLAGTTEENVANRSVQGEAPPNGGTGSDNSATNVANGLNPSAPEAAASQGGTGGAANSNSPPPTKDPIGNETASKSANVVIVIRIPNP